MLSNKLFLSAVLTLFLSVQYSYTQDLEIPQIPAPIHVSQNVLQWSSSGSIVLDKDKKHDLNLSMASTYSNFGNDFESVNYTAILRTKIKKNIRLTSVYTSSKIVGLGWANSILFGPQFEFENTIFKPSFRLTYNYVWFGGGQDFGVSKPIENHRFRLRIMGRQAISKNKKIQLILLAEPFLYKKNEGALKEIRSNIGIYFLINKNISIIPLYGLNWSKNDVTKVWRHTVGAHMTIILKD